jgi:hypothetical protein
MNEELRRLRLELVEYRIEIEERRIPGLQREVRSFEDQLRQVQEEAQSYQQSLDEVENQLSRQGLSEEERLELENRRAQMRGSDMERLRSQEAELARQQAQARIHLNRELQQWQKLVELKASMQLN